MEQTKEKLKADIALLEKALSTLEAVLKEPLTDIIRDASIQRFQYTFESAWKAIHVAAKIIGIPCHSPRDVIKMAYKMEWIVNADKWFEALEARNKTSHIYHFEMAQDVYDVAKKFPALFKEVLPPLTKLLA